MLVVCECVGSVAETGGRGYLEKVARAFLPAHRVKEKAMQARTRIMGSLMMVALAWALPVQANHIQVGNVGWVPAVEGQSYVTFDLSWSDGAVYAA